MWCRPRLRSAQSATANEKSLDVDSAAAGAPRESRPCRAGESNRRDRAEGPPKRRKRAEGSRGYRDGSGLAFAGVRRRIGRQEHVDAPSKARFVVRPQHPEDDATVFVDEVRVVGFRIQRTVKRRGNVIDGDNPGNAIALLVRAGMRD